MVPGLLVRQGPQKGMSFQLLEKKPFRIGRHPQCDLLIGADPAVSAVHCQFVRKGSALYMKEQSRNGTRLNGRKVHQNWVLLKHADILRVGQTHLEITDLEDSHASSGILQASLEDVERREVFEEDSFKIQELGGYQPIELIGSGSFGVVYKALNRLEKRIVALKVITENSALASKMVGRFLREAELLNKVEHPHLIQLYEAGQIEKEGQIYHFIAMEYFSGVNLSDYVVSSGKMIWTKVLKILLQLAEALDHLHRSGVIHRDLKPENVLYNPLTGVAKVIDLGFGKCILDEERQTFFITQTGSSLGTPYYMPIEQWEEAKNVTETADIYSLGATAYFMLSGRAPFEMYQDYLQLFRAVSQQKLTPLHALCREDTPSAFLEIIHKMMAFEAKRRYPTSRKLLKALQEFVQEYQKKIPASPTPP
jgi:serine/threonine protein kinase